MTKRDRDGTEIEEPENWSDEDRAKMRLQTGADLPDIITSLGWYKTRAGLLAHVFQMKPKQQATANCVGHIFQKGKTGRFEFSTWQQNGRWKFLGECPKDIVSKA